MHHKIVMDPILKESRGFGFVTYDNKEDANDAVKEMNDYEMDGKRIIVEIAKRSKPRKPTPGKYLGYDRSRDTYRSRRYNSRYGFNSMILHIEKEIEEDIIREDIEVHRPTQDNLESFS